MDLTSLLTRHPNVRLFDPQKDQSKLFKIMERSPMKLPGLDLVYDRTPDFEALLKCQSSEYTTLVMEENNELIVFTSISCNSRYVDGQLKKVSYVGDMRTVGHRKGAILWRKFYADFIQNSRDQADYHLTAVLADNQMAIKNLVETKKDRGFKYDLIKNLGMVNHLGIKPFAKVRKIHVAPDYILRNANESDTEKIKHFLTRQNKLKNFGYDFEHDEFNHRQSNWPGFRINDFLLILNKNQELIGCTLPWSPSSVKRMRLTNIRLAMRLFLFVCYLVGLKVPKKNESLRTLYLTHLTFSDGLSKSEVASLLSLFLKKVFQDRRNEFHMVSWADDWNLMENKESKDYFKEFVFQVTKVNLYSVRSSFEKEKNWDPNQQIGFEMALV